MEIDQILNSVKDIAVIGVSKSPYKAAHTVPKYMLENGYNIIPINPTADKIFDIDCYNNIFDVEENIDMVNIFRPSNEIESIVKDIIKRGKKDIKVIWLQQGIFSDEGRVLAEKEGIIFIENRCLYVEHVKL